MQRRDQWLVPEAEVEGEQDLVGVMALGVEAGLEAPHMPLLAVVKEHLVVEVRISLLPRFCMALVPAAQDHACIW